MSVSKIDRRTKVWYIRDHNRVPYAVVVGHREKGVGWALCGRNDKFCKRTGLTIALARMGSNPDNAPRSIREEVYRMEDYLVEGYIGVLLSNVLQGSSVSTSVRD